MVTIKEIAKEADVSITTVSRVLNNPNQVNLKTRGEILETIKRLDYTPSIIARGMRNQKTKTIGVLIPDFMNFYYSEWISHIETESRKNGYLAIIASTKNDKDREKEYVYEFLSRKVEGIIFCWYRSAQKNLPLLKEVVKKVPIVLMDQPVEDLPLSTVYADSYKGFLGLTQYLIKKGHKKIAIIKSYKEYSVADCRFQGYIDALNKYGYDLDDNLIEECDFNANSAYTAAKKLLSRGKPSAIVGVSDLIAIGALKCVIEKGFCVPKDVAIAGYDNIAISKLVTPSLTTVQEPIKQMAQEAVKILIDKIKNKWNINKNVVLDTKLIIRGSTDIDK